MEKKQQIQAQGNTLSNIPEVIDPGVTIPIYEEDIKSSGNQNDQQKLGSYRARTGKISNTLSNLLPSISARLHHSKKKSSGKNSDSETQSNGSSDVLVDLRDMQATLPRGKTTITSMSAPGVPLASSSSIISSQELDSLVNFPDATSFFLDQSRNSTDSYALDGFIPQTVSRSRNNTMSSQITSLSSVMQQQTVPASTIWSNNPNSNIVDTNSSHFTNPVPSHYSTTTSHDTISNIDMPDNQIENNPQLMNRTNNVHIFPNSSNYYEHAANSSPNLNTLSVPNSSWANTGGTINRQRATSNASSIYIDATYDQQSQRQRQATFSSTQQPQQPHPPLVADDIDPVSINWVTMDPSVPPINRITNLLPTDTISISNVFSLQQQQAHLINTINLTSTSLATLCSKYGDVVSARTLSGLNMALVEFSSIDASMKAMDDLQGKEVSMMGAQSSVFFAKILPMHQQQVNLPSNKTFLASETANQPLLHEQLYNGSLTFQQQGNLSIPIFNQKQQQQQQQTNINSNFNHSSTHISTNEKELCPFPLPPPTFEARSEELKEMVSTFSCEYDSSRSDYIINNALNNKSSSDTNNFGPLPEHLASKEFDAPKLRELRKNIDADQLSSLEIEQLAMVMLDELPELCSDYIGNTIVQKLFEHSSDIIKDIMLRKTSKYLTSMGVHKNGTWACQKMITMAHSPRQIKLVANGVRDYCTPLFNDQFGNYVIQCVLKFGFPWNNFIFENILSNFWVIVQSRYGARAVRACLEATDIVTKEQTLILSATIVLYADYLTTNSNGTLLVTWFLDTCSLANRYTILASRLVKNIVELACHRLASLTILKMLNYRGDDESKIIILNSIFGNKETEEPTENLRLILSDSNYGHTFVYKILSMATLDPELRSHAVKMVRSILLESTSSHHHHRLMEEVGLSSIVAQSPSATTRHHPTASHSFNQDVANHMRQVSTSSILSNGSRQNGTGSAAAGTSIPTVNVTQAPIQGGSVSGAGYFNYPGMFPGGYNNGGSSSNNVFKGNEDFSSQFDMLTLNNGTILSLPKLSLTNYNSNTSTLDPTKSNTSNGYGY
ncbi:hypothetical protein Kpol_520p3 [Vanderwaltozyma polyspora DSM 70294]|uniref:PUM-HD domain-containing protein n=1 Tax=Vanderwaltozyma polyspora (strain ATCC 22028 / DSM 70294 / BCRC 21397 / CBS 2163 / NBRC 10782 / NRRL Y-8283 / UCD 57-17) TaxID=436907 RepID=A7TM89_VANPO|nr:uncharacterized protein Kpol_520p3 [Vanderwaltozyma polyspora DSM 70294]EDO16583.1 hypothetical protein Kpol_520p3 [Vanderwaltozyma polyspora DSM 70294]